MSIQVLVDQYGCCVHWEDASGLQPHDYLVMPRGRPGSPSGTVEREDELTQRRRRRRQLRVEKELDQENEFKRREWKDFLCSRVAVVASKEEKEEYIARSQLLRTVRDWQVRSLPVAVGAN